MRQIKYRFWDTFNGHMVYDKGNLSNFFKLFQAALDGGNNPKLMQYTGLKDKNRIDIYAGHIVEAEVDGIYFKGRVMYEYANFLVNIGMKCKPAFGRDSNFVLFTEIYNHHWTITGDIYQHPELLEKND